MQDQDLFALFKKDFLCRSNIAVSGSPNRSVERFTAQDTAGNFYFIEKFDLAKKEKQIRQSVLLDFLQKNGVPGIHLHLRTAQGGYGVCRENGFWQMRPFAASDSLPRHKLGDIAEYGVLWGQFLVQFKNAALLPDLPDLPNERFFFAGYIHDLLGFIQQKMPDLYRETAEIAQSLQNFVSMETSLPAMLAHGDFHPGNILIKNGSISAVIDWEFAGWKSAGYDLALLLGCLGRDDPAWFNGKAATALQKELYMHNYLPEISWRYLPELIAAIRLGWLGEWVDLGERTLAQQELQFIRSLLH